MRNRHVIAAHFVYAFSVIEQLVKVLFINKALLSGSSQLGLFRCRIKSRFYKSRSHTDTIVHRFESRFKVNSLSTGLATFTAGGVTRERWVQLGIGIVDNPRNVYRTITLGHIRFGIAKKPAVFIELLTLVRDKEQTVVP